MKKFFVLLFLSSIYSYAQIDTISTIELDEVKINSIKLISSAQEFPGALTIKQIDETWQGPSLSLQEYLTNIPGISSFNSSNYAQDLRLSIRGFGARSAFGIRGIKVIVDGIPETTPDGQGQLDNLPLSLIRRFELIRGSSALRYGNASGGVLHIETLDYVESPFHTFGIRLGQYSQKQFEYTAGIKLNSTHLIAHLNHNQGNGYRQHSQYESTLLNLKVNQKINSKSKINLQFNLTNSPIAKDAGGQTQSDLDTNRSLARDRNVLFDAGEKISHQKIGATYSFHQNRIDIKSYAFASNRNFMGKLPFSDGGIVHLKRNYFGQGSDLTYAFVSKEVLLRNQIGYAYAYQNDQRKRYINQEGLKGTQTLNQWEQFSSLGFYFIQQIEWKKWLINGGIRWDKNVLTLEDNFISDGDSSDSKNLNAWSPQFGISYEVKPRLHTFINFSKSYETPALSELSADPSGNGGFNSSLGIQEANTSEIGFKQKNKRISWTLTAFHIDTKNDLIPYQLEAYEGRTFYRNAGRTLRKGLEADLIYNLGKKWRLITTYNLSDFTYQAFEKSGTDYKGKVLPGIPIQFGGFSAQFTAHKGWFIRLESNYRGKVYTNDSNTSFSEGFWKQDIALNFPMDWAKQSFHFVLGINNLTNQFYSDNIRINAFGGRFFEAAPERMIYARMFVKLR